MRPIFVAAILAGSVCAASAQQLAPSPTLDAIKARGHIECGVHLGLPGFLLRRRQGRVDRPRRRLLQGAGRRRSRRRQEGQVHADLGAAALADPAVGPGRPALAQLDHHLLAQRFARPELPGHQLLRGPDLHRPQEATNAKTRGRSRRRLGLRRGRFDRGEERLRLVPASAISRSPSPISRRTTTPSPPMIPVAATPTPPASARLPASASSSRCPTSTSS